MSDLEKARQDELTAWVVLASWTERAVGAYRIGLDLAPYLPDIEAAREEWNQALAIRMEAGKKEREEEKLRRIEEEMRIRPPTIEEINAEATPEEHRVAINNGLSMADAALHDEAAYTVAVADFEELKKRIAARVIHKRLAARDALTGIKNWNNKKEM